MSYQPIFSEEPPIYSNEDGEQWKVLVDQTEKSVRLAFVRKVYAILSVQLAITVLVSCLMFFLPPLTDWVVHNPWTLWVNVFFSMALLAALHFQKRVFPLNLFILFLFTMNMSFVVGLSVVLSDLTAVLQATVITFIVFVGLTLFTMQSKWDFSGMAPFLLGGLLLLIGTSFVGLFIPYSSGLQIAMAVAGVLLFSGYIVFDTFLIFKRLSPEEYVVAAVELYLDVINLFLQFLQLTARYNKD